LVSDWKIWGDHPGDDAEVYTGVQAKLNNITIKVEEDATPQEKSAAAQVPVSMISTQLNVRFLAVKTH
jgi:hypothetical protein